MNQEANNPTPDVEAGEGIPAAVEMAKDIEEVMGGDPNAFSESEEFTDDPEGNLDDAEPLETPSTESAEEAPQESVEMVTLGDRQVPRADVEAWEQGNMRQADYTRKTQEVARGMEQNAADRAQIEATQRMFDELGVAPYQPAPPMPSAPYQGQPPAYPTPGVMPGEEGYVDPQVTALQQQVAQYGQEVDAIKRNNELNNRRRVKQTVDGAAAEFKGWYKNQHGGDEITPELMNDVFGTMNRLDMRADCFESFEAAWKSSANIEQIREEAGDKRLQDYLAEKKKDKTAIVEPSSAPAGEPSKYDPRKHSDEENFEAMSRDLKGVG